MRLLSRRRGQATTEYILIVVLVAVLSIGILTLFSDQIRALFGYSTKRLAGETGVSLDVSAATAADAATKRSLKSAQEGKD